MNYFKFIRCFLCFIVMAANIVANDDQPPNGRLIHNGNSSLIDYAQQAQKNDWFVFLPPESENSNTQQQSHGVDASIFRSGEALGMAIAIDNNGTYLTLPEALRAASPNPNSDDSDSLAGPWRVRHRDGREILLTQQPQMHGPFCLIVLDETSQPWHLEARQGVTGQPLLSFSNHAATAALATQPAVSIGLLSAFVTLPDSLPMVPGRRGQAVSEYRGELWEISNAVTYGASGGPVLDESGAVVALTTLAQAPERRVGSAIPLHIASDLIPARKSPAPNNADQSAEDFAASIGLLALQRPAGLGNPRSLPRPASVRHDLPAYQRDQQMRAWERYLHQQQILWRDQPVSVVALDDMRLLTAAEHLHGDATQGFLVNGQEKKPILCMLEETLGGIAVFKAIKPHGLQPITTWSPPPQRGDSVCILAKGRYASGMTLQSGVVSSDWRYLQQSPWLQIDARMNYGNLGGLVVLRHIDGTHAALGIAVGVAPHYHWLTGSGVGFVSLGSDFFDLRNENGNNKNHKNSHNGTGNDIGQEQAGQTQPELKQPERKKPEQEKQKRPNLSANQHVPLHGLQAGVIIDQGSGIIISQDGLVLSNHHVTGDALVHTITLWNGEELQADRLGTDPVGDLSLYKISDPPEDLPWTPLAQHTPPLAAPVWAVGNPFDLARSGGGLTWSFGHLSAIGHSFGTYWDCLVADAPVNPGNSGGGLLNSQGELIGINGMISSRTGFRINSGLAFAISHRLINAWLPILQAANGGYCRHTAEPDWHLKQEENGHFVIEAGPSPLAPGDLIHAINGVQPMSRPHLTALLQAGPYFPDVTAELIITRQQRGASGTSEPITIELPLTPLAIPGKPTLGVDWQRRPAIDIPGAVVAAVPKASLAERAGLRAGHIVTAFNDQAITRRLDVLRYLRGAAIGEVIEVTIRENTTTDESKTLSVPLIGKGGTGFGLEQ